MVPAGLGESDVVLKEDVLKKEIKFVQGWLEWAAQNREIIIRSGAESTTLFTVPAKNTFFLTSMSIFLSKLVANQQSLLIGITSSKGFLMRADIATGTGETSAQNSNAIALTMPLKFEEGETISTTGFTNGNMSANITGFLVPKRIS